MSENKSTPPPAILGNPPFTTPPEVAAAISVEPAAHMSRPEAVARLLRLMRRPGVTDADVLALNVAVLNIVRRVRQSGRNLARRAERLNAERGSAHE